MGPESWGIIGFGGGILTTVFITLLLARYGIKKYDMQPEDIADYLEDFKR
jgi:hypothetical protein